MQVTIQGDNVHGCHLQQHGHMLPHGQGWAELCNVPTKTLLNPWVVEDPGDFLLHLLLPLPSYSSHIFLDAPLHSDPRHTPHAHTTSFTFSPHHPSCILCTIIQTAHGKDDKISNTTTYCLHYAFNILYKLLQVSLKKIPPKWPDILISTIQA